MAAPALSAEPAAAITGSSCSTFSPPNRSPAAPDTASSTHAAAAAIIVNTGGRRLRFSFAGAAFFWASSTTPLMIFSCSASGSGSLTSPHAVRMSFKSSM